MDDILINKTLENCISIIDTRNTLNDLLENRDELIYNLHYINKMTIKEISNITNLSNTSVAQKLWAKYRKKGIKYKVNR